MPGRKLRKRNEKNNDHKQNGWLIGKSAAYTVRGRSCSLEMHKWTSERRMRWNEIRMRAGEISEAIRE
jgi:hypothetical protein